MVRLPDVHSLLASLYNFLQVLRWSIFTGLKQHPVGKHPGTHSLFEFYLQGAFPVYRGEREMFL